MGAARAGAQHHLTPAPPSTPRRAAWVGVAIVLVVLAVLAVRWWSAGDRVRIIDAVVIGDGSRLEISVASCSASGLRATVAERPDRITVDVRKQRTTGGGDACADGVTIDLEEPLGDRVLVDDRTGEPVPAVPVNG